MSSSLNSGLSGLGLSGGALSAGRTAYQAEDDPPIFWGTHDTKGRQRRVGPYIARSEALVAPARWKNADLEAFQRRMFDAGLYGSTDAEYIPWGVFDPTTQQIWRDLVDTAAVYAKAGKQVRPQDLVDQLPNVGGGGSEQRVPPNPLDLRAASRAAGTVGQGRALTSDEQAAFESGLSSVMTSDNPPGAAGQQEWAEQKVRSFDPLRFDARAALSAFDTVAAMFRGDQLAAPDL